MKGAQGKAKKPESTCAEVHTHTCKWRVARPRKGVRTETGFPLLDALRVSVSSGKGHSDDWQAFHSTWG